MWGNLLKDSIVNQKLGGQCCQQGDADSQAKTAAWAVERPPQTDGERSQSQRQLYIVGKVHFLTEVGSRNRQSVAPNSINTTVLHCSGDTCTALPLTLSANHENQSTSTAFIGLNTGVWHYQYWKDQQQMHKAPKLKDTALAWLMPTKTATQRITLDHSRLNLCGSPRRLSMQGYNSPIIAAGGKGRKSKQCRKQEVTQPAFTTAVAHSTYQAVLGILLLGEGKSVLHVCDQRPSVLGPTQTWD